MASTRPAAASITASRPRAIPRCWSTARMSSTTRSSRTTSRPRPARTWRVPTKWTDLLAIASSSRTTPTVDGVQNGYTTYWCGTAGLLRPGRDGLEPDAWSWGGELWDPTTYKVQGIINSDTNCQGAQVRRRAVQDRPGRPGQLPVQRDCRRALQRHDRDGDDLVRLRRRVRGQDRLQESDNLAYALAPGEAGAFPAWAAWACTSARTPRTRTPRWPT